MKKNKLTHYLLGVLLLIFTGQANGQESINISTVINSNLIIGDNNIQNISYTMKDHGVDVSLNVIEDETIHKMEFFPDGNVGCSTYTETKEKNGHKFIFPNLEGCVSDERKNYLNNYIFKSKISMIDHAYLPWNFNVNPPVFDLRVINNKDKSISIEKININVNKSEAYKEPLVFLWHNDLKTMSFMLNNEGNTTIQEIEVEHYFSNKRGKKNYQNKYHKTFKFNKNHKINDKDTGNAVALSFNESLKMEGVDVDFLNSPAVSDIYISNSPEIREKIKVALGKYTNTYNGPSNSKKIFRKEFLAFIYGTMKIKGNYQGRPTEKTIEFDGIVPLTAPWHAYGDLVAGQAYDVRLKNNGENYTINLETSKYLKPFEAEKFLIRMMSIESGFHSLSIDIVFSDNSFAESNDITFFNWSPRTKRELLASSAKASYLDIVESTLDTGYRLKVVNVHSNDVLKIRQKPNHKSGEIGSFPYNFDNICPTGETKIVGRSLWISVKPDCGISDKKGWVNSRYLAFDRKK